MADANSEESKLIIEQIEIGSMANFTYIVGSRSTREVAIVDPAWDVDGLIKHLEERDYTSSPRSPHTIPPTTSAGNGGQNRRVAELMEHKPVKV
ncbi:MAG: hypothetical protein Ct9H300mP8_13120 [Gammaproteobacteria bacterium]|nr:MAG: hypothetical protein Ct9H300mP8_13120 [Gammaproteobacteria bacterium]